MKIKMLLVALLVVCLSIFTGCSCEHDWIEADCLNAKTCSRCGEVKGEALGHTTGEWIETTDTVTCSVSAEQSCKVCNTLLSSKTTALSTLIQNDLFLFTPAEFMERLTLIAGQHEYTFTYEFIPKNTMLQALVNSSGKQSIIQFFRSDTSALTSDEADTSAVWCVSLAVVGDSDGALRLYFFMACDPMLDKNAAFELDTELSVSFLNAKSSGESFGYYQYNELLYESTYIPEGDLGQVSMNLVNIYASDFR